MQILSSSERVPIKGFTEGVQVEDAALQQLKNTASLPFIYKHLAVMPDVHAGKGSTIGSVVVTKGAIIPACVGVDIGCFVGETKIPLLNGTQKTLRELEKEIEPFWIYSVSNFKVVPGKAICKKTRSNAELVKVTISGGDEVICTPDHQFMLLDGTYKEAQHLRFNESLMPLYRKWQARDGYESANCGFNTSGMVHKSVWQSLNGKIPDGYVVHHKDHVHFNNSPDNLELLTISDHSAHHRATGKKFANTDPKFQIERMKGIKRRVNDPESRKKMKEVGTKNITKYMQESRDEFLEKVKDNGKRGSQYLTKFNQEPRTCNECDYIGKNPADLNWHKRKLHGNNHKVISVNPLGYKEEVYCATVPDTHTFTLEDNILTGNCHHNYVNNESHFGSNVLVTRKGAVRARKGDLGIIPGSMGAKSFIVRGKGNPDSFNSCSHGAGRMMSRTAARKLFTVEDHIKATEGVNCRKDEEVIDETPAAYKSIDDVMNAQKDLVEIVHTLKQVLCVKG